MHDDGHRWDSEVLHDILDSRDVGLIKKIPIPLRDTTDTWFWLLVEKGEFTVKS